MAAIIEETSTITAKGQTTVPKAVRQALGVDYGGKIAYRIEKGRVTVRNPAAEHRDPALAAFLAIIETDIAAGRNISGLPAGLAAGMRGLSGGAGSSSTRAWKATSRSRRAPRDRRRLDAALPRGDPRPADEPRRRP